MNIDKIVKIPKNGYYPHNNIHFNNNKIDNKKYAVGKYTEYKIKTGYWTFYNKCNIIVECGLYADDGKKYGLWYGYYGGKKDFSDRLKYETNYINDKIIGIQKFYKKTSDYKSVYLWKEIEYDHDGNLTGNMTKYNENNQVISKIFIRDNVIILEKYENNNIRIHQEYDLLGRPINIWFNNKCIPRIKTKIYRLIMNFYKKDYDDKFNNINYYDKKYFDKFDHKYYKLQFNTFIDEIRYTITFDREKQLCITNIYDNKDNNIICEITNRLKYR